MRAVQGGEMTPIREKERGVIQKRKFVKQLILLNNLGVKAPIGGGKFETDVQFLYLFQFLIKKNRRHTRFMVVLNSNSQPSIREHMCVVFQKSATILLRFL